MKLHLKLFILFGGGYGIFQGFKVGASNGLKEGIIEGALSGVFFGLFMSIFIGWWQKRKTRKLKEENGKDISPKQSENLIITGVYEDIFKKSLEGIKAFKGKIRSSKIDDGLIFATTKISWKSFGEKIEIRLKKKNQESTEIKITSSPSFPITIVDYGKGRENILSFIDYMKKLD